MTLVNKHSVSQDFYSLSMCLFLGAFHPDSMTPQQHKIHMRKTGRQFFYIINKTIKIQSYITFYRGIQSRRGSEIIWFPFVDNTILIKKISKTIQISTVGYGGRQFLQVFWKICKKLNGIVPVMFLMISGRGRIIRPCQSGPKKLLEYMDRLHEVADLESKADILSMVPVASVSCSTRQAFRTS